ncbi:TonB-dependent receptor [Flavisolibacter nicotianae]|uniref:TonB-dependent receptor n=1 Tax=Flavisolibacter nicotianae TaxID=2364882 RepID=UPI000EB0A0DE|nr:TonB-dependent receptor [Flavisolibacter nicotianae]
MQGSFEKKVQEKMEELQLSPSAPVWEKIELQVRPEKKRRRILFWLLFPTALLAGGMWWLLSEKTTRRPTAIEQAVPGGTKTGAKKQVVETSEAAQQKTNTQEVQTVLPQRTGTARLPLMMTSSGHQQRTKRVLLASNIHDTSQRQSIDAGNEKTTPESKPLPIADKTPAIRSEGAHADNKPVTSAALPSPLKADTPVQQKAAEEKAERLQAGADSGKRKAAVVQKKVTGKILLTAGWSWQTATTTSGNLYSSPSQSANSPGTPGPLYQPQHTSAGVSFSLGYAMEKALSGRLTLTAGIQYAYYSTRQKVGNYKTQDTTLRFQDKEFIVAGYFSNTAAAYASQATYTNHFHVAELPVSLQYQLVKRLPLFVTAGASYGRLLSSNALTVDQSSGLLYLNKENNRKHSFNLFAATQFAVVNKKSWKLTTGPVFQYNAVPLQKTGSRSHLLFAGLKTGINF